MTGSDETVLQQALQAAGQDHLWSHRDRLPEGQQAAFTRQLQETNWPAVKTLIDRALRTGADDAVALAAEARRAQPPDQLVRQPASALERAAWRSAANVGLERLKAGKVAAVVVAGGQGTRLGFDLPKGMFPIGPVSGHSLFRIFCEQILARSQQAGRPIPYGIMTSDATHDRTVAYFDQHRRFDLPAESLRFFRQGNMPAVDATAGRALLAGAGELALSPDGHGGILHAMVRSGWLDELTRQGIETLFYHQVDNPTTILCDPAFLGWHAIHQADVSTKVVAKRSAEEKMGVAVSVEGVSKIIEYSDLPADLAGQTDEQGQLRLWAGNTAIHVFQLDFLRRTAEQHSFPFHIARKAVPYLDAAGQIVTPETPNAFKFEQFIFDLLPLARRSLIVETNRAAEFNPVKNKDGHDSPATCRSALLALHRQWVLDAGAKIADHVPIEISPLFALDADGVARRLSPKNTFDKQTFLTVDP